VQGWLKQVSCSVPIGIRQRLRDLGPYGYCGRYDTWDAARAASVGYESPVVLERTSITTAQVRDGDVPYQQDGISLAELPDDAYRLALVLNIAARQRGGNLRVLDFGGALAGTYFGCRSLLAGCERITWNVVEQPIYCERGRRDFADSTVNFFENINEATAAGPPDVVLCLSALQFMEHPFAVLQQLVDAAGVYLVLERTPFVISDSRELTVQRMPSTLYRASYPSWLLSESELRRFLTGSYDLWLNWTWPSAFTARAEFRGLVFKAVQGGHGASAREAGRA
jgi:putative methyltransferase (TIGR04325 family)